MPRVSGPTVIAIRHKFAPKKKNWRYRTARSLRNARLGRCPYCRDSYEYLGQKEAVESEPLMFLFAENTQIPTQVASWVKTVGLGRVQSIA